MNSKRHRRVTELFGEAVDLDPSARGAFLDEVCAGDDELRRDVAELLAIHDDSAADGGSFLAPGAAGTLTSPVDPGAREPDIESIGPYRILSVLGEGGMGVVYLAEQREPVRRRVAIKLIKPGMDTKAVLSRFEAERQALSMMEHTSIAKVLEAGTSPEGRPYFVMEYIRGVPFTDYCDQNKLDLEHRLRLFIQVCDGVQHAHQKGIIHRDLKPANILVTTQDGKPLPKIIDFGLARAVDQRLIEGTLFTQQGQILGTPAYMSPEQAGLGGLDLDTRTDVYSLGVLFYQLLVGELPFTLDVLRNAGFVEMQRMIRDEDPPRPSTRISTASAAASKIAAVRRTTAQILLKSLRQDLDWVVMTAMEKDRNRRYQTVRELAMDVERYLNSEPVHAGPPNAGYRIRKFAQKYRTQVSVAALLFVAMVGGTAGTTWFMLEAQDQEAIANTKTKEALHQAGLAKERLAHFEQLAVMIKLEEADAEQSRLYPAWPEHASAFEGWLRDHAEPLASEITRVRGTMRALEANALPQSAAENKSDREGHPQHAEFEKQRKIVAALQLAMDVRTGKRQPPIIELPEKFQISNVHELKAVLKSLGSSDPGERSWGKEPLALAYARHMVSTSTEPVYYDSLAWAWFGVGMDENAKAASQEALDKAPENAKAEFRGYQAKLTRAIESAPAELASAKEKLAILDARLGERATWRFERGSDTLLYRTMKEVDKRLVDFTSATGWRHDVQRRLRWARRIEGLTHGHPKARVTWATAAAAIATADGVVASKLYAHKSIALKPQMGLVPIGMNPVTKLWEFYHLRSAWDPSSDTDPADLEIPQHLADGRIEVRDDTGIVFVLIPAGSFTMGSQKIDPNGKNHDRRSEPNEELHEETLGGYFLARHEMTQGQWRSLSFGDNPSQYFAGTRVPPKTITLAHPVERVSWIGCRDLTWKHGLRLPSEAEWEYGCRGGTDTVFFAGGNASDLEGFANVLDKMGKATVPGWRGVSVPFDDGHAVHAPVGSYRANPFGLHDVVGNVFEWCMDRYGVTNTRVVRGGCFDYSPWHGRSANRNSDNPTATPNRAGMRAARTLHRAP